jgi:predicted nucleic acid-binding protein
VVWSCQERAPGVECPAPRDIPIRPVVELSFNDEDARVAGLIRATLEASGKPIGAFDLLIAGQALAGQFTLVTAKVSEFSRVKGLSWQDWAKP